MNGPLAQGLMDLIHTEILCSVRRLLPGDLKVAFVGPGQGQNFEIDENVFGDKIENNEIKGGVHLNDYLSFNCLVNTGEELQSSLSEFECEFCQESMYGSSLQIVGHYSKCSTERDIKTEETYSQEERKRDPNAQEFDCKACGKLLYLTSTEILRHRRSHND